jgi:Phage integrase, N-terminal SAM-like domain
MQRVTSLKTERQDQTPAVLLEDWRRFLQEHDYSAGTVKKYTQAVAHFLSWYEREERVPL